MLEQTVNDYLLWMISKAWERSEEEMKRFDICLMDRAWSVEGSNLSVFCRWLVRSCEKRKG